MSQENSVRAVERALAILDCFTGGKNGFSLMEIAREIELSPSTTLRLLATLEKTGYLYRDPENLRYCLSYKLAQISNIAFDHLDFCRVARPFMEKLCEQFQEGVGLYVRQDDRRVCVARIEGTRRLRSVLRIGDSAPLHKGASGRVLLAYRPEEEARRILGDESPDALKPLRQVRELGYAVSYGEREPGVISIAAPLFNAKSEVVAALFLTGATSYMDEAVVSAIIAALTESAVEISLRLGYRA